MCPSNGDQGILIYTMYIIRHSIGLLHSTHNEAESFLSTGLTSTNSFPRYHVN